LRERDNQARESWESAFGVGLLMAASGDHESKLESQADVDVCLRETGVTRDQVNRWRREGLLPPVEQKPAAYRGSEVLYPPGTCAQIRTAAELFAFKNRVEFVGWELWWRGFWVDECHWRPHLIDAAEWGDRAVKILKLLKFRDERRNSPTGISDRVAPHDSSNSIYLKTKRRISQDALPALIGTILDTATGDFDGAIAEELEPTLTKAFDIAQSTNDQILGKRLRLIEALPGVLHDIARVSECYSLDDVVGFPISELEAARDDVRGAMQIATDFYAATSWIYGPKSFGLRFAAFLAQKSHPAARAFGTLVFAARRSNEHLFLSSDEIRRLANEAALIRVNSEKLRLLQRDPRFSKILSAKRLRRGLRNPDEHWTLLKEIKAARIK
jgi:hypothetical protein